MLKCVWDLSEIYPNYKYKYKYKSGERVCGSNVAILTSEGEAVDAGFKITSEVKEMCWVQNHKYWCGYGDCQT